MNLTPFAFEDNLVRSCYSGESGPLVVGKDACIALGISKYRDSLGKLDPDERVSIFVDTPGGSQKMVAVTESGLYRLIFSSKNAQAVRFRKWVTEEVLPTIRKTGSYSMNPRGASYQLPSDRVLELIRNGLSAESAERLVMADFEVLKRQSAPELLGEVDLARKLARMGNPMERAEALGALRAEGKSVREITTELGTHVANVYLHLSMLRLCPEAQEALRARDITLNTGAELTRLPLAKQRKALKEIRTQKLPERAAVRLTRKQRAKGR